MGHYKRTSAMLTVSEMARLFNVHASTVRRWSDQGILKAYRIGARGDRRFRRSDVAVFYLERALQKYSEH